MFDIIILAVGKIKHKHFKEAVEGYLRMLKPYARVKVVEIAAEPFDASSRENSKRTEAKRILSQLEKMGGRQIIVLDEHGQGHTSGEFAGICGSGRQLLFIVGGALGLTREVSDRADLVMALSKLTFPHELARLMLIEQLYRAATISRGKTYHY